MADILNMVPPEVFGVILEKLRKADLKSLSQTSRYLHAIVANTLWRSITSEPWSEFDLHRIAVAGLPEGCLQLATHLHFRSDIQYVTTERCPHANNDLWGINGADDGADGAGDQGYEFKSKYVYEDEHMDQPYFDRLTQKAKSLLERLKDNQLHSFSWDLGTCIPSKIMGTNGIVPLKQAALRSLSLTTDSNCPYFYEEECEVDLSSFRQLQSLSWRGPHDNNLSALSVAIRDNSAHLKKLELDFVNWAKLRDSLGYYGDEEDEHGITAQKYFAGRVLCLNNLSPRPLLPAIRTLSLSQVPLVATMARAINFGTLESLTLRMCPGWDKFLERVVGLNLPIKLRTLEIQASGSASHGRDDSIVIDFLDAFEGLQELFVTQAGPVSSLELWDHISRRHTTLQRFVHHQRIIDLNEGSPYMEEEHDLPDLAIFDRDMCHMKDDPEQNPLTKLNLEYIGLACIPTRLECLLLPFKSKTSLKVVHIRQSSSDLRRYRSWAVDDHPSQLISDTRNRAAFDSQESFSMTSSGIRSAASDMEDVALRRDTVDVVIGGDEVRHGPRLREEFCQFAEWVFGPQGISSLQIVVFGDFAYGGRTPRNNLLICRNTSGSSNFQLLDENGPEWMEVLDEYRNALEACPVEPLLGD